MNQKGSSLISVIVVFFVLSIVGLSVWWMVLSHGYKLRRDYDYLSAVYAAESGIEYIKAVVDNILNDENGGNNNGQKKDLQKILNSYVSREISLDRDSYFILKAIDVDKGKDVDKDKVWYVAIASEGHAGNQVYTAYAKLMWNVNDTSGYPSVQAWKVIKGVYNDKVFKNL